MAKTAPQPVAIKLPEFVPAGAPPEDRMHWVKVPFSQVQALYDATVFKVQRNHHRRLRLADHVLLPDVVPQSNYLAVRTAEGAVQLVDGYTRIAAISGGLKAAPENVWLGVMDIDNPKQAEQTYQAIDSRKAVKTGRDAFEEGLRKSGLLGKLNSPVFINGNAVSALRAASGEVDPRTSVGKFKKAIERLDPLHLAIGRNSMPAGALAGCLLLAQHEKEAEAVLQFTAALAKADSLTAADKKLVPGAVKLHAWLQDRRQAGALSGKNVAVIQEQVLGAFRWQQSGASGKIEPLTREAYLAEV